MPLTRTRRRILIATLVVVPVLVFVWLRILRLDQRLVGSWERVFPPDVKEEEHLVTTFRADGYFEVECTDFPREVATSGEWSGQWWVRDGQLVQYSLMGQPRSEQIKDFVLVRVLGQKPASMLSKIGYQESEIVEVTQTEFRLRHKYDPIAYDDPIVIPVRETVYRRVAE